MFTPEMQQRLNTLSNMVRNSDQENEFRDLSNQFALSQGSPLPYPDFQTTVNPDANNAENMQAAPEQPQAPQDQVVEQTTDQTTQETSAVDPNQTEQTQWTESNPSDQPADTQETPEVPTIGSSPEGVANDPAVDAAIADQTQIYTPPSQEQVAAVDAAAQDQSTQTQDSTHPLVAQRSVLQTMLTDLENILMADSTLATREVALFRTKLEEAVLWVEAGIKKLGL